MSLREATSAECYSFNLCFTLMHLLRVLMVFCSLGVSLNRPILSLYHDFLAYHPSLIPPSLVFFFNTSTIYIFVEHKYTLGSHYTSENLSQHLRLQTSTGGNPRYLLMTRQFTTSARRDNSFSLSLASLLR